jgi:uncharacterized protein YdaU (DUF1376 family)
MNYYKRHLGDYARDTGHLTALEHGIYTLLLDWYYVNECPIPADKAKRIARGNPEETQTVLSEFFILSDSGWQHARADREIAEYHAKAEHNRKAGKLGGRPRKTQTVSKPNPDVTLATSHKPLASKEQKQKTAPAGELLTDVDPQVAADFTALRHKLRAPITQTAVAGIRREAEKAGLTLNSALAMCCERGWRGFKAEWVGGAQQAGVPGGGRKRL